MKNKKLFSILEGVAILVLGILIAVLEVGAVMNNYIAVLCIVFATLLFVYAGYLFIKRQPVLFAPIGLGAALVTVSVGIFVGYLGFEMVIRILHFALLGVGAALMLYSIYTMININGYLGVFQLVAGAAIFSLSMCYYFIPGFRDVFWIIVGVLIAVYGALFAVFAIISKEK